MPDQPPSLEDLDALLPRPAPSRTWRERMEALADATGSTPGRLVVGALVVVLAAGVGGVWLLRAPSPPPEVSLPFVATSTTAAAASASVPETMVVHVAGAVRTPGVFELEAGARVGDAITAAGGLDTSADQARINLAAPVADGERVYVLASDEAGVPVVPGAPPVAEGGPGTSGPLDLNTADEAALEGLPGVGPATAAAIVEHRGKIGRFTSVDQLLDVPGIGDAKLEAVRDLVTV